MNITEKMTQAIPDFVKGGNNRNIELLNKVLHDNFRATNNGVMGTARGTIINKHIYQTLKKKYLVGYQEKMNGNL